MNAELWIWMGVGCLPWWVSRRVVTVGAGRRRRRLLRLEVRAIFWRLVVEQPPQGRVAWRLHVPLIERLQQAVWTAVQGLLR